MAPDGGLSVVRRRARLLHGGGRLDDPAAGACGEPVGDQCSTTGEVGVVGSGMRGSCDAVCESASSHARSDGETGFIFFRGLNCSPFL